MLKNNPLLEVEDLTIQYRTESGPVTAVANASFIIDSGEYFGLVGESGSGKSTIAKSMIGGLDDNGEVVSGSIRYKGEEIQDYTEEEFNKKIRWDEISYVPQSSMNSLDPLRRVDKQAIEIAKTHTDLTKEEILEKFGEMFEIVGLNKNRISDYPHEFSGGMKQRAVIALALFLDPDVVIADEPTTALDVIMQDQVFKYLQKSRKVQSTSMILITHDISLVFEECSSLAVMHGAQMAEVGPTKQIYESPKHPYSILLQDAFPDIRFTDQKLSTIEGHPPKLGDEVNFCTFAERCPWAVEDCKSREPKLEPMNKEESVEQQVACHRKNEQLAIDYENKKHS